MPELSPQDFWTVVGILVAIILALVNAFFFQWHQAAKLKEERWQKAVFFARIYSDDSESELTKEMARVGLLDLKIVQTEIRQSSKLFERLMSPIGAEIAPDALEVLDSADQKIAARSDETDLAALGAPVTTQIDADLGAARRAVLSVSSAIQSFEEGFARARAEARPEEDTRVRIFLISATFVGAFTLLLVAAVRAALL